MSTEDRPTIRQYLENYKNGKYDSSDRDTQINAGWYDWFCMDSSLYNKTKTLTSRLRSIVKSGKINQDTMYVFFKNNCPCVGGLYDDFRICDVKTNDVVYTVVPRHTPTGYAEVWGRENGFGEPIVKGTWKDVKDFFLKEEKTQK